MKDSNFIDTKIEYGQAKSVANLASVIVALAQIPQSRYLQCPFLLTELVLLYEAITSAPQKNFGPPLQSCQSSRHARIPV
jgi:hypothetical protein